MKRSHVLDPTTSNKRPTRIIFFDTETSQTIKPDGITQHALKLGVAKFATLDNLKGLIVKKEIEFYSPGELWVWIDEVCKKKSTTYLVAHNLTFDLSVCNAFRDLAVIGWELGSFYSKGMVSIFRWREDERRLVGLDNGNFFKGKLEKWGKLLGLPKLEVRFDEASNEELLTYCHRDVDIMVELWVMWIEFLDVNRCGSFKPTVSSTAFNTWRHRFMRETVHIHTDELATQLEREAYKGGRTEVFWVGRRRDGPFYYMDVNNMYGFILANRSFPAGIWNSMRKATPYQLAYKLDRFAVIARVHIEVDEPYFPLRIGHHTCYPVGDFWTTLTTPELKLVIDRGWLIDVGAISWYRQAELFKDYVDEFHNLRVGYDEAENPGFAKICKLLVHGIYGKFGQRGMKQEIMGECDPSIVKREKVYDEEHDLIYDQVYLAGRIYREYKEGEAYHSFPAIAAHVTAEARIYLYNLVREIPPGSLYYVDTDSLVCGQAGYDALKDQIDPHELGNLKVETTSPWLEINAPKDYRMEGRIKTKGIREDALEIEPGVYKQTQWLKLSGLIQDGISEGYITKEVTKRQRRLIHSGRIGPRGWVFPHVLHQGLPALVAPLELSIPALK